MECSMSEGNEFYTEWTESYDSFDQMNLHENLLRGIYAYGTYGSSAGEAANSMPDFETDLCYFVALQVLRSHPQSSRKELFHSGKDLM